MPVTIEEIEKALQHLSREDLTRFRAWYDEFEAHVWDNEFESDVASEKLEQAARKAMQYFKNGRCSKL